MSANENKTEAKPAVYVPPHKRSPPAAGAGAATAGATGSDALLAAMFTAIKNSEAAMVEADAKRVADAAAAGTPVKELSFDELLVLRRKYNPRDDEICPAAKDRKHTWSPLRHCGNSWHGAVYGKDCTSCGHGWSSH